MHIELRKKIFGVEVVKIEYELGDLKFEWDSVKAEINLKKHKIAFEDAALVFFDENRIDEFDEIHSDFEDRYKIIGKVENILTVIYTEREENFRIISARQATKREEVQYYEQFHY